MYDENFFWYTINSMKDNVLSKYTYLIDTTLMLQAQKQSLSVKCIDKLRISTKCLYFFFVPLKWKQIKFNGIRYTIKNSTYVEVPPLLYASSSYKKERRWSNFHYCLLLSYRFSFNLIQTLKFYRQQRIVKWKAAVIKSRTMH